LKTKGPTVKPYQEQDKCKC